MQIRDAEDVLELLGRAARRIERDLGASDLERGKALAAIAGLALRAIEVRNLAGRMEAIQLAIARSRRRPR